MKLGFEEEQTPYESGSQEARSWTERWAAKSLFCPACGNSSLTKFPNNKPVADLFCPECSEEFELKSQKSRFRAKVLDGAYRTMRARIEDDNNPNFFFLNYSRKSLSVTDLFVVPKHFFVPDILEKRPPLAPTARRAGWIGCNILLEKIPAMGKIPLVVHEEIVPRESVLRQWNKTLFLRTVEPTAKGWLLDVLRCVESIGRPEFALEDVYAQEQTLQQLYPNNNNVRPKIRQQLQVLRDQGILEFLGRGHYRLRNTGW